MASFLDLATGLPALWAKIKGLITQSDWEEDDTTSSAHVLNRPAVRAGEGENSVVVGQIENDSSAASYDINITGNAGVKIYNYSPVDALDNISLSEINKRKYILYYPEKNTYTLVTDIDIVNHTITLTGTLSSSNVSNVSVQLLYSFVLSAGKYSYIEGLGNAAIGNGSHAEGYYTRASGVYSHAEGMLTQARNTTSHAEGARTEATGMYSHAEGYSTKATGLNSHAEGHTTEASGTRSHAEGRETVASGEVSHAEGKETVASGDCSSTSGYHTTASNTYAKAGGYHATASGRTSFAYGEHVVAAGLGSHAVGLYSTQSIKLNGDANALTYTLEEPVEFYPGTLNKERLAIYYNNSVYPIQQITSSGNFLNSITLPLTLNASSAFSGTVTLDVGTYANGNGAHAEGNGTSAIADASHAEGGGSIVSGGASHAEGIFTIANHRSQHVFGEYNVVDPSTATINDRGNYVEIVGNGSSSARSNAYTLDWSGNGWYAGKVTVGSQPTADMDVATKKYVDDIEIPQPEDDTLVLNLLTEYGYAAPIADASGNVITEDDGTLVLG